MQIHSEPFDFLNVYKALDASQLESKCHLFSDFKARLYSYCETLYRIRGTRGTRSDLSGAEY